MPKAKLVELFAQGLGVIEDARIEFGAGFNVLTGETGAGKTLLLGALQLCLGRDGATSRYNNDGDLRVSAVFVRRDGSETVLARETSPSGRLRSTLDGVASSAEALQRRADELIVLHGQHDSLTLRNRADVLGIVDASAGVVTNELDDARTRLHRAVVLRDTLGGDESRRERELDYVIFSIREIEAAAITSPTELDDSLEELTRLTELRDGQSTLQALLEELDPDSGEGVLPSFAMAIERLPAGASYDAMRNLLRGALDQAREAVHELASLAQVHAFDDQSFERLIDRITMLQQIARKHGGSLSTALVNLDQLRAQRDQHSATTDRLAAIEGEIAELEASVNRLAQRVRRDRQVAATQLTEAVRVQLPRVALANASLRFEVGGDDGSQAQILFTPNPGRAEGPLESLASGGELSRILLALSLETVHADVVAVFDEIDAGIGGQIAQQIGECLREVGSSQQVLAVTHLASVAAKADHHFVIEKSVRNGTTSTTVRQVSGEERINEIARMLAGDEITTESRALAQRLLETSR